MSHATTLLWATTLVALCSPHGWAEYQPRYAATTRGALTFTGNALGLSSDGGSLPGTVGSIGAFISLDPSFAVPGGWPAGTTTVWADNGSAAELRVPAGATIVHAELIWGGYFHDLPADIDAAVTLEAPDGAQTTVPPGVGLSLTDPSKDFYAHAVTVTAAVIGGGPGTWAVRGVPASLACSSDCNLRSAGWTLAVAYTHPELPLRNLSLWFGLERGGAPAATLAGICTPSAGEVRARVLVSALEGDQHGYGDNLAFGPAGGPLVSLSGPNNNPGNFFAAQINDDQGELDTSGSFGDWNLGSGGVGRHGWDITNVDGTGVLPPGASAAQAQGITSNEQYRITALGLQIDTGQPIFEGPTSGGAASETAVVPAEIIGLTWTLSNHGAEVAEAPRFAASLGTGLEALAGTTRVDGVPWPDAVPSAPAGLMLDALAPGAERVIAFDAQVIAAPGDDVLHPSATLSFDYTTCGELAGAGLSHLDAPTLRVARLQSSLTVAPTGLVSPGQTATFTLSVANVGAASTRDATLAITTPVGLDYVADSLVVDGAPRPGPALPAAPFPLDTLADPAGVLPAGSLLTVTWAARISDTSAPRTLSVAAQADDSAAVPGAPPASSVTVAITTCGDGRRGGLEACDDGLSNSDTTPNACRTDCTSPRCGDGVVDAGEGCDPGATPTLSCAYGQPSCAVCGPACEVVAGAARWCGDGVVDEADGEACDDGADNSDTAPDACRTDCSPPRCGDGVRDRGEGCDDGDRVDDDACDNACVAHLCGNGVLDEGEECDAGRDGGPPCAYGDPSCRRCGTDCHWMSGAASWCGDGEVDLAHGEVCDDANTVQDLCRYGERACGVCGPDCRPSAGIPTWCGDGSVDAIHGELCDDGNTEDGDGCSAQCQPDTRRGRASNDGCQGGPSVPLGWGWTLLMGLVLRRRPVSRASAR